MGVGRRAIEGGHPGEGQRKRRSRGMGIGGQRDARLSPLYSSFRRFPGPLARIVQGLSAHGPAQKRQDPCGESCQGQRGLGKEGRF